MGAIKKITTCAIVQLVLGLPFLLSYPFSYIAGAFNFGRKFDIEWSYNWRFLSETFFRSGMFAAALILCQLAVLFAFALSRWNGIASSVSNGISVICRHRYESLKPLHIALVMFTSNFIGIVFCRSLHYQFFAWYAHSLPLLLWSTRLPIWARITIMALVEMCWNQHPPVAWSSGLLQVCHFVILISLWMSPKRVCG